MKPPPSLRAPLERALAILAIAITGCGFVGCGGGGSSGGGGAGGATPSAAPRIDLANPTQGAPGVTVTIQGSAFGATPGANVVFFGSAQANVSAASPTQLTCTVPAGAPAGAQSVTVSTTGGTSNALSFNILGAPGGGPTLSSLAPNAGPVGTQVTISGSGFDPTAGNNQVQFNGTPTTVTAASSTQLTVTVPSGATTGPVVVTTTPGASNGLTFTVTTASGGSLGSSGSRALDYLTAVPFSSLLVEVDFVQGHAPDSAALDRLRLRLQERCNKPGGVTIRVDDAITSPGTNPWRLSDLQALEQTHRNHYSGGTTAVLYFVYVDGGYEADTPTSKVLGLSYTGSSLAMFKQSIVSTSALPLTQQVIERAVLVHEAGHALGLVNNGVAMQVPHQDTANGAHDTSDQCVMHFSIETSLVAQLTGTVPDQFDALCVDDLKAAGGR